jgi:hypothetical protein
MNNPFHKFQRVTLVREVEQSKAAPWFEEIAAAVRTVEDEVRRSDHSFAAKAVSRAQQLASVSGLSKAYDSISRRNNRLILVFYTLLAVLGFVAVMQSLISDSDQINVYWLLLVLLGVNTFSILLWFAMWLRGSLSSAPLTAAYRALVTHLSAGKSAPLFKAWSESFLLGKTGQWFLSTQIHACWLMYLFGGFLALLLVMSGKQLDFVWGTTILSPAAFATLTAWLGHLPSAVGFAVPDEAMVLNSVQGTSPESLANSRAIWASFLLGSVIVYAVVPRLLLWLLSFFWLRRARAAYQPDWELPYFYALRAALLPHAGSLGVVDADKSEQTEPVSPSDAITPQLTNLAQLSLPTGAYVAAFEWGSESLPEHTVEDAVELASINDLNAQTGVLQALSQSPKPIVVLVELRRAADRGAARFFSNLSALTDVTLVVVRTQRSESDASRWAGWQAVAERIKLPENNLHLVDQ